MHIPSSYERYIQNEISRYGYEASEENELPCWLELEFETFYWMFYLGRTMYRVLQDCIVSKRLLKRIEQITTIRFLRYRDISPSLKEAVIQIAAEFKSLNEDLQNPEMWRTRNLLSKVGAERWRKATEVVIDGSYILPDPEWRESWEKEKLHPYCTRKEAETIAKEYILKEKEIDLAEISSRNEARQYHFSDRVKDGVYRMEYGYWETIDNRTVGVSLGSIEVDMLSRNIIEMEK